MDIYKSTQHNYEYVNQRKGNRYIKRFNEVVVAL